LLELLIDYKYDLDDYTKTMYNPTFEVWQRLNKAKVEKDGAARILQQMWDSLVPKDLQPSYNRGASEFLAIYTNNFTILEAGFMNKLKNIEYISGSRYKNFQSLLSVANKEVTADAVLILKGLDPDMPIPLNVGEIGVAAQLVPVSVLTVLLPEMKTSNVYKIIPWFLSVNKMENLFTTLVYLDELNPDDAYLELKNLIRIGLTRKQYDEYIRRRDGNRNSGECCLCTSKTTETLKCKHYVHHQCLARCTTTKCPMCKADYELPEPYNTIQRKHIEKEREKSSRKFNQEYLRLQSIYGELIPEQELHRIHTEI
jgi:hypothetical protein